MSNKSKLNLYMSIRQCKAVPVNGTNQNDRLEILKAKCEQEIKDCEDNLRLLKAKLANLIDLSHESEKLANPAAEPDRYVKMGYTEAILDAVQSLWNARKIPSTAVEIKNHLLAHGFRHGGSFDVSVYTILKRLLESGRIKVEAFPIKKGGPPLRGYRPK